jgi:2'-5' RNA ligase
MKPLYRQHPTERLFVAIVPPPSWIEAIARFQDGLMQTYGDAVKWVDPQTYHITARFLGNIEKLLARQLTSNWQQDSCCLKAPLSVTPTVGGCFPASGAPRIVWVGVTVSDTAWHGVLAHIDRQVSALHIECPASDSTPHITLGRIRHPSATRNLRWRCSVIIPELAPFEATHLNLMMSQQTPAGNRYVSVARCRFLY